MPEDNIKFNDSPEQKKCLHQFRVEKSNHFLNTLTGMWNVDTAFHTRFLKQYRKTGTL